MPAYLDPSQLLGLYLFTFAAAIVLRRWFTKGGYLVSRRSRLGPYPHLLWTPELGSAPVEQFKPIEPRGWWFLVFRGRIVRGDEKPGEVPGGENA